MADTEKITILLADEDALRRDGLAAVLQGTERFRVIAHCPDGERAIESIRNLRPDVAVIDLNLPKVHGIELVRRVRGEALGTKMVILSGTSDDEIIREVVRAGGDGYLLKNGPARHLIDAISYVRDGGQYFSPQLRRDGLDRHLLEEKPRAENPRRRPENAEPEFRDGRDFENPGEGGKYAGEPDDRADRGDKNERDDRDAGYRGARDNRYGARSRRPVRRTSDPQRFRERLREEAPAENLGDRDYEILGMMADGIRPILDRLDEIEGRVVQMESGDEPLPQDPRGWISSQIADTFRDPRATRELALGRSVQDLEARLPQMIEQAVTSRFQHMAEKLHQQIEDTHLRTLETFVKNIQVKLVQRVSKLELDMTKQAEAMHQLQEYSLRTEDNLSRLISGVDKLAQELPRRLQAAAVEADPDGAAEEYQAQLPAAKPVRRRSSRNVSPKLLVSAGAAIALVALGIVEGPKFFRSQKPAVTASGADALASASTSAAPAPATAVAEKPPAPVITGSDTSSKLQAAQKYSEDKQYPTAEDIYKQILKTEPNNAEALKGLASVLYREDKIEESAQILDRLPKN